MTFPSLIAPVNLSTDLVMKVALRTTAALRYADHHLNAVDPSFLVPPPESGNTVEVFCVSQACITSPMEDLKRRLQSSRIHDRTVIPVESKMWVEALGKTSITFGHFISFEGNILARMTRIYVRKNMETGRLVEVTEKERSKVFPATPTTECELPSVTKYDPSIFLDDQMEPIFTVRIGPQHCNNDHVDHAALADLLLQGLASRGYLCEMQTVSVTYLLPASLNETLRVSVHKDKPVAVLYKEGSSTPMVVGGLESPFEARNRL